MPAQVLKGPPADKPQPVPGAPPGAPAARPAATDEPSPAQILTEAFDDLRRRMVNIEGRLVSLGSAPGEEAGGVDAPQDAAPPPRPGRGRAMRAAGLSVIGALCFGVGIVAAEGIPEVGAAGRSAVLWAEGIWSEGMASVAVLLDR